LRINMMRYPPAMRVLLSFSLLCVVACHDAGAQATESAPAWYDADTLLDNLRREDRRAAAEAVAPLQLNQLPFYDLDLALADDQATFQMVEDIYYTNTTGVPQTSLVLRLYANAVGESAQVLLSGSECVGLSCQVRWDNRSVFEVRPATPLPPNGRLHVRLQLRGTLQHIDPSRNNMMAQAMEGLAGSGASEHGDYGLLAHGSGIASMGNFYAMVAPFRNGDWVRSEATLGDLGADTISHFRARIHSRRGSKVAVTGKITEHQSYLAQGDRAGYQETVAVASMTRNFAIVIGNDMQVASEQVGPVEVRSWFLPQDRDKGMMALDAAAHSVRIFERRFGRYPYTDLEVVEAPLVGGAGGVEFSSLVTVATMFYQSAFGGQMGQIGALLGGAGGGNPLGQMQDSMLEFVVAHEVAHQWWHGIVGSDAQRHPFVDESLAQYSAMLYMEERYGAERAEREANRQVAGNYHMMRMQGGTDGSVDQPTSAFTDGTAYAGLVYGKGPYLYPALREALGERRFFRQIRGYVSDNRFRVVGPRTLIDRMATGNRTERVRGLARRWLEESHGDEDLGEPNMERMMGDLMGQNSGLENLAPLIEALGAGAGGGNADTNRALQDLTRQLQNLPH
jgi:hypothetical protein